MRGMRVGKSCSAIEREERTREWGGWKVALEVWKEDSGKVIRFL